ncbi:phage holin family protein [Ornithinibacillus sp. 4-3]|uniref:Phage holin family protein n=1 Tax=Ornithinibacillus sp. 4-3 TaxID=3231488 RepID=A0AB39HPK5_9BACI
MKFFLKLLSFVIVDYVLGALVAVSDGQLNSKIGLIGITITYSIDRIMEDGTDLVIFFCLLANELLSVLEAIPEVLKKVIYLLFS